MGRYNNTERLGVNETDRIVTKYLGWIFREQPIIDVGLDAIIEQSIDGNPTGKFIAAQIKSGESNFHISDKHLTYYVSHIHYNYWSNLDIPIILIAHFPESEKTYWQHISERTFKKTKKKWKIEIPKRQEFNEKSKKQLITILSNRDSNNFVIELYKGQTDPNNLFDFAENTRCIGESADCVINLTSIILDIDKKTKAFNETLFKYAQQGLSDKDAQVRASIKGFGKNLNVSSKRLESEIELFAQLYSTGFFAYEQVVLSHFLITKNSKNLEVALKSLDQIPKSVDIALQGIAAMREGVSKLPKKYSVLKEAKNFLLQILDLINDEFSESRTMTRLIIEKIKEVK